MEWNRRQDPTSKCLCSGRLIVFGPLRAITCFVLISHYGQVSLYVLALFSNLRGIGRTPPPKAHRGSGGSTGGGAATVLGSDVVVTAQASEGSGLGGSTMMEARVLRLERERNMLKLEMDRQRLQFEEERQACEHNSHACHLVLCLFVRDGCTRTSRRLPLLAWHAGTLASNRGIPTAATGCGYHERSLREATPGCQ